MLNELLIKLSESKSKIKTLDVKNSLVSIPNESVWIKVDSDNNNYKKLFTSESENGLNRNPIFNFTLMNNINMSTILQNKTILSKFTNEETNRLLEEINNPDNKNVPLFFLCEKIKGAKINNYYSGTLANQCYVSALSSTDLSDDEYEELNEKLYGKKAPKVQKLFDDFKQKYPDIKLMVDNDVTLKKAKGIIKATEEFINYQRNANAVFAQTIQFTKMEGQSGFYKNNKIYINIFNNENYFNETLAHENGHLKDDKDFGLIRKNVSDDIKPILKKVLSDYSAVLTTEAIAELTKAIETPNDKDICKMTKKIRIRKNENGNLVLMIAKKSKISKEETEKLGSFFRSCVCPEIIPDYDSSKHGPTDNYNETIIRNNN